MPTETHMPNFSKIGGGLVPPTCILWFWPGGLEGVCVQPCTNFAEISSKGFFWHASWVSKRPQYNSNVFEFWNTLMGDVHMECFGICIRARLLWHMEKIENNQCYTIYLLLQIYLYDNQLYTAIVEFILKLSFTDDFDVTHGHSFSRHRIEQMKNIL